MIENGWIDGCLIVFRGNFHNRAPKSKFGRVIQRMKEAVNSNNEKVENNEGGR